MISYRDSHEILSLLDIVNTNVSTPTLLRMQVEINEKASRQLFIVNSGKFNFDFAWELHNRTKVKGIRNTEDNKMVSITPESGTVPSNTRKRCQMAFCPPARLSLQNCDLFLKVSHYLLLLDVGNVLFSNQGKNCVYLGCVRLTLFRLFRNKNKISNFSPDSQNNQNYS